MHRHTHEICMWARQRSVQRKRFQPQCSAVQHVHWWKSYRASFIFSSNRSFPNYRAALPRSPRSTRTQNTQAHTHTHTHTHSHTANHLWLECDWTPPLSVTKSLRMNIQHEFRLCVCVCSPHIRLLIGVLCNMSAGVCATMAFTCMNDEAEVYISCVCVCVCVWYLPGLWWPL